MYNNNIRTDSEIHKFINSEFRNGRLRLEWPLMGKSEGKDNTVCRKSKLEKSKSKLGSDRPRF